MTRRISLCLFGQASSISSHAEELFVSSWWCKIYTTVLRGTRKMKSEYLICEGKNGVYGKRSNVHICQKRIIYVNTGWRQLAREYYIKLIMGRWPCISEILIILAVRVYIVTEIHAECGAMLPVPLCSGPLMIQVHKMKKTNYMDWNVAATCKQYSDLPHLSLVSMSKYFSSG